MSDAGQDQVRRLPPGPHGLPSALVERNQRERLISAMAEVCEEHGYADSSVAAIARRAGVSTASFYRQFDDKRACMLASFEELFGRLLVALEGKCDRREPARGKARAGIRAAAELLAGDLPTARLLCVEILAVGPEGLIAQHKAIDRLAALLREPSTKGSHDPDAAWAYVAAIVSSFARRLAEGTDLDAEAPDALTRLL